MLHLSAWALALGASAAVVVGRVAMPARESTDTVAAVAPPPAHTTTVTRTVVETVHVRARRAHARRTRRASAPAPRIAAQPVASAAPAPSRHRTRRHAAPSVPKAQPQPSGPQHVDGDAVDTRYGVVQVRLVLDGSRITDVIALAAPNDVERSRQITADAIPRLRQEVLAAQSAGIDAVAGATYTSQGYRQSVQSALDLA